MRSVWLARPPCAHPVRDPRRRVTFLPRIETNACFPIGISRKWGRAFLRLFNPTGNLKLSEQNSTDVFDNAERHGGENEPHKTVRAELIGSSVCVADRVTARGFAPVLSLCRTLVEAGYDPGRPLEAWRDGILALRVRSIGEAAELIINSKGTDFVCRPAVRKGSLVAESFHPEGEGSQRTQRHPQ